MNTAGLAKLLRQLESLNVDEITRLKEAVDQRESAMEGLFIVREREKHVENCPHCRRDDFVRFGRRRGRQRFRCKDCRRTFTAFTRTPLARLRWPEKHIENARAMVTAETIRQTAKRLKVAGTTAFRWRHRFLNSVTAENPGLLVGIVEADETFFRESFKGQRRGLLRRAKKRGTPAARPGLSHEQIPVLVARERSSGVTLTRRLASRQARDLAAALVPKLTKDAILMTDSAKAYKHLAKAHGIDLRQVPPNAQHRTSGALHLNNVNAYASRLKEWMKPFKGVATRHLAHYLGWHRWHDANTSNPRQGRRFFQAAIKPA